MQSSSTSARIRRMAAWEKLRSSAALVALVSRRELVGARGADVAHQPLEVVVVLLELLAERVEQFGVRPPGC